jgi:hypothetical protein
VTTLVASCSNCTSWRHTPDHGHATSANVGFCGKGLFPPQGEPRCESYQITDAFKQKLISAMMKDQGPMAMPVKLIGGQKSAKQQNRKLKKHFSR